MSGSQKPKVAFLMNKIQRDNCFSSEEMKRLESFATVIDKGYEELDKDKMIELIKIADGILTCWGTPKINEEILKYGDSLKIICHAAGTVKPYITEEAMQMIWDRNIAVTSTSAALGRGVAEFALGMIILGMKKVFFIQDEIRKGEWQEARGIATDPYNVTIGVIGGGYCGSHLIKLLQNFEVKILLYDPYKTEQECKRIGAKKVELDYLLSGSDVITLHAPYIPQTTNLIDREGIKRIRDGAVFINTASGIVVDEKALIEELKTGRFYACLDVTHPEPPATDNPLRNMKNVFLTPHIAGHASNGMKRQGVYAVDELQRFFKNEELKYQIRREEFGTRA